MLHIPEIRPEVQDTPDRPIRAMNGRRLNHLIKQASPRDRALLAVELAQGAVQVVQLTYVQARALTGASSGYVSTTARLTADERVRVARGQLSLARLHRGLSDKVIDRFIVRAGADRVLAALDRYTQPSLFPAE